MDLPWLSSPLTRRLKPWKSRGSPTSSIFGQWSRGVPRSSTLDGRSLADAAPTPCHLLPRIAIVVTLGRHLSGPAPSRQNRRVAALRPIRRRVIEICIRDDWWNNRSMRRSVHDCQSGQTLVEYILVVAAIALACVGAAAVLPVRWDQRDLRVGFELPGHLHVACLHRADCLAPGVGPAENDSGLSAWSLAKLSPVQERSSLDQVRLNNSASVTLGRRDEKWGASGPSAFHFVGRGRPRLVRHPYRPPCVSESPIRGTSHVMRSRRLALVGAAAAACVVAAQGSAQPQTTTPTTVINIKITLTDSVYRVNQKVVPRAALGRFLFSNQGTKAHAFTLARTKTRTGIQKGFTKTLKPGQRAVVLLFFDYRGRIAYRGSLPWDQSKIGMKGFIEVS